MRHELGIAMPSIEDFVRTKDEAIANHRLPGS
jgi:hypothetical protein